jgi:hypothetical protein
MSMLLYLIVITWSNLEGEDEEAPKISLGEQSGAEEDPQPAVL